MSFNVNEFLALSFTILFPFLSQITGRHRRVLERAGFNLMHGSLFFYKSSDEGDRIDSSLKPPRTRRDRGDERKLFEPSHSTEAPATGDRHCRIGQDQARPLLLHRLHGYRASESCFGFYGMDQSRCWFGTVICSTVRTTRYTKYSLISNL